MLFYDPLRVILPTTVEGKHLYREECDEKTGWNWEVSSATRQDWLKWSNQLRNVTLPRSIVKDKSEIKGVQLHVFANASNTACSAATVAVVDHSTGFVKGLLTSTSRILKCNTTHCKAGTGERADGRKYGEEPGSSIKAVAHYFREHVVEQYGGTVSN